MADNRNELITVTMTAEQWDAAYGRKRYPSWETQDEARKIIDALVSPGYTDRWQAARREALDRVPRLNDFHKPRIEKRLAFIAREFLAGRLKVDHLGSPSQEIGPWRFTVIPRLHTGGHGFHIRMKTPVYFDGHEFSMKDEDRQWFIDAAKRVPGIQVGHDWGSSSWVSIAWTPAA